MYFFSELKMKENASIALKGNPSKRIRDFAKELPSWSVRCWPHIRTEQSDVSLHEIKESPEKDIVLVFY